MTTSSDEQGCCGHCACSGEPGDDKENTSRRDFLAYTAGAMGAVGAAAAAWPLINSMNPAADTLAMSTTEVDVSGLQEGQAMTAMWRGKPVFIRRRTAKEVEEAVAGDKADLRDPETDAERFKQSTFNGKAMPEWLVVVGVCTHLGCIPLGQKPTDPHGEFDGWFCPCHGSQYDSAARIRKGPAPNNLAVPPYAFIEATKIKIG
jgi:ubiquinol-cytochrome c reductase iron-sulfur subunit